MNILSRIYLSAQYRLSRVYYHILQKPIGKITYNNWQKPIVYSIEDTLSYIIDYKSSICRFGDGEFNIALGKSIGFQKDLGDMPIRMNQVLNSEEEKILVAIPDIFGKLNHYDVFTRKFWEEYRLVNIKTLKKLFPHKKAYFNSFITRFKDYCEDRTDEIIPLFRKIWNGRDVYMVEGEQTRVGVGNDLLDNASNVYRILAPAKNAYDVYDKIISSVKTNIPPGSLVIIALGPTATILAFDLAKMGYQALDLGHFDIQYECHLRGISSKEPVPGKYVNEAAEAGQTVDDSEISDNRYYMSIISIVR